MYYIVLFMLGLVIGSFLNVCIYRIPREESIAYPPSHCTNCQNKLKVYHLIPVISYIFLKGKCSYCGKKVSIRYLVIELFTGIIFVILYSFYGMTLEFTKFAFLSCFLIVMAIIDIDTMNMYFETIISGIAGGIVFILIDYIRGYSVRTYIIGGLIGGVFIASIILITKGMGWGDAEMCLLCGLYLGWEKTILMIFLAIVLGAIIGILLIITKKKNRKDYIPFGPYISLATLIVILHGRELIAWYLIV